MEQLYRAIKERDIVKIRRLVKDIDVNEKKTGSTPLHEAIESGSIEILKLLLKSRAKVSINDPNLNGESPLILLFKKYFNDQSHDIKSDFYESVQILLNAGADPNQYYKYTQTFQEPASPNLLHKAVGADDERLVKILINAKADVDEWNSQGHTPLIMAINQGAKFEIIQILVEAGAEVKFNSSNKVSVLELAARKNDVVLIKYLISRGADLTGMKISANTVMLQLILDQLTTLNKNLEQEKKVQVERWNGLERKIEKIEERIGQKNSVFKDDCEKDQE